MYDRLKQLTGQQSPAQQCETVVGQGSRMKGEISCKGPSHIAGHVEGDLIGDDRLLIGPSATIVGKITAAEIEIDGHVQGTITATTRVILNESAKVEGDLHSPLVIIEEGARFNGTSHMPMTANPVTDLQDDLQADNIHKIDPAMHDSEKLKTTG